jgi:hemoglobin
LCWLAVEDGKIVRSRSKDAAGTIGTEIAIGTIIGITTTSAQPYERLGGVYSIATVIDDFIDRVMMDPRLNANPRVDEAHHRVPPAGFKYLVTEMLCWAAGGPQKYTGRAMKESHQHLMITAAEWEAFLDDLQQTLDKFAVPEAEQAEIKAIIGSTRTDIVV